MKSMELEGSSAFGATGIHILNVQEVGMGSETSTMQVSGDSRASRPRPAAFGCLGTGDLVRRSFACKKSGKSGPDPPTGHQLGPVGGS